MHFTRCSEQVCALIESHEAFPNLQAGLSALLPYQLVHISKFEQVKLTHQQKDSTSRAQEY